MIMNALLKFARERQAEIVQLTRRFVECESPSEDRIAVDRMTDLVADVVGGLGQVSIFNGGEYGKHLRCEFALPGRKKDGSILLLGHADTVWPVGTLHSMPFRQTGGRLWGPGVLDMKSGVAFSIFAIRALVELDHSVSRRVFLQLNSDEEIGSPSSRSLTEEIGRKSSAVLVLEFGDGTTGKLKTSRKGVAVYNVEVTGSNSHAGLDLEKGANAILELSKHIMHVSGIGNPARGTTVNVGLISGGTRPNVVPAEARMDIDVRFARMCEVVGVQSKLEALAPFDKRCKLHVTGGVRRPPMKQSAASRSLFQRARSLAGEIGVPLEESATGGTSDGNFTAALGVPTLDGLGGVGEGPHALYESIFENRIPDRVAMLAGLIASL